MQMEKTRRGSDCTKSSLIHTNNGDNHPPNCTLAHMIIKTNRTDSTCHDFALNNSSNVIVTQHAKRTHIDPTTYSLQAKMPLFFFTVSTLTPREKRRSSGKRQKNDFNFRLRVNRWVFEMMKRWFLSTTQRERESPWKNVMWKLLVAMHFTVCLFIKQPHSYMIAPKYMRFTICFAAHLFLIVFYILPGKYQQNETRWFGWDLFFLSTRFVVQFSAPKAHHIETKPNVHLIVSVTILIPEQPKEMGTSGSWTHALHIKWFEIKSTTRVWYFTARFFSSVRRFCSFWFSLCIFIKIPQAHNRPSFVSRFVSRMQFVQNKGAWFSNTQ